MPLAAQLKHMPVEPLALALFALADELEEAYPGISEKYGWVRLADVTKLAESIAAASGATKPEGMQ